MFQEKCNCGREVRYAHPTENGMQYSCNKHNICPTYEDLLKQRDLYKGDLENVIQIARIFREGTQHYNEAVFRLDMLIKERLVK